jgi:AcrR family transcriptional regulator
MPSGFWYAPLVTEIAGEQRGRRRHAQRNHELLVAAAREVFAEQGVEAALDEIAWRAGLGIGTLYRHFTTREALVEAIFAERIGELVAVAEGAAAEPDGWSGLVHFLERTLELQAGDRVLKALLMRYPPGEGRLASAREELGLLSERVLERAREDGALRDDFTLSDLALLFWSFTPLIDATAEIAPSAWRRHLHWLLEGLRAGGATPPPGRPLSDEELRAAMETLRAQRLGRRA